MSRRKRKAPKASVERPPAAPKKTAEQLVEESRLPVELRQKMKRLVFGR